MTPARWVHPFSSDIKSPSLLGGRGAGQARLAALGVPIPPGFTIGAPASTLQRGRGDAMAPAVRAQVDAELRALERTLGRRLDGPDHALLVSVRAGAAVPMSGMLDAVTDIGLTDEVVGRIALRTGEAAAWQSYARFLESYAEVVRGIDPVALRRGRAEAAAATGPRGAAATWKALIARHGPPFPQRGRTQLDEAIAAVWRAWADIGTAVTVQAVVCDDRDERSGSGVVFTRDPCTGRPGAYGDFLRPNHPPEPIDAADAHVPEALAQLRDLLGSLEQDCRDMCRIAFTVERGRLWVLDVQVARRSGPAAVLIATDMVDEGLIDFDMAVQRIPLSALEALQAPVAARGQELEVIGRGVGASSGTAIGQAVFDAGRARRLADAGHDVILVRPELEPGDRLGLLAARGIVSARGAHASETAIAARDHGRPAVCGVAGLRIDANAGRAVLASGAALIEGDVITVEGSEGTVRLGAAKLVAPQPDERVARLLSWCDERARTPVLDQPPAGFARVGSVAQARAAGDRVLVDPARPAAELLAAICDELLDREPPPRLALVVPATLGGGDLRPPPAAWEAIVATPATNWAARVLSARINQLTATLAIET